MSTEFALLLLAAIFIPVTTAYAVLRNRIDQFADRVNRTFRGDE